MLAKDIFIYTYIYIYFIIYLIFMVVVLGIQEIDFIQVNFPSHNLLFIIYLFIYFLVHYDMYAFVEES